MKRISALVVALMACATLSAQPAQPGNTDVIYYGVDFSKTRVFAASETGSDFKDAFARINSLVIGEWAKYAPDQFFPVNIVASDISPTVRLNDAIDPLAIVSHSSAHTISTAEIADMLGRYKLDQTIGTGLVIIGESLNKSTNMGTFYVVIFDIATREYLQGWEITGKARGFGLRNYWAGALYAALRSAR